MSTLTSTLTLFHTLSKDALIILLEKQSEIYEQEIQQLKNDLEAAIKEGDILRVVCIYCKKYVFHDHTTTLVDIRDKHFDFYPDCEDYSPYDYHEKWRKAFDEFNIPYDVNTNLGICFDCKNCISKVDINQNPNKWIIEN